MSDMICREIEREIKQENKVLLNLTIRQIVCLGFALASSIVIAVFLNMDFAISIYPCFVIGALCFAFGWIKQDGLYMEHILLKKLEVAYYHNDKRLYRTKNKYTVMLNKEYARRKAIDQRDKKLQKRLRKEKRGQKKKSGLQEIL